MTHSTPPARRLALIAGLLTVALVSCGREITGPGTSTVNAFKRVAAFAFSPQYETAVPSSALQAALTQVAFERVRITLRREDGTIALDTVVNFPAGADALTLSLIVPLAASAPASGVPLTLNLGYVNAAGDTVFKGGPIPVMVTPSTGGAPPAPVQVPVHYTGTGSNAAAVSISPKSAAGLAGLATTFSAQALGAGGAAIPGTPIVYSSSDPGVVRINNPSSGAATFVGRGTAWVYAQLLTGPIDSAAVTVTLPASVLSLVSGGSQTATAGTTVPLPMVAKIAASDGIGVGGVTVTFAVASGGGTITPASAVSAADGQVSANWKLGPTAGTQSVTMTSAGLIGSPITVTANALPVIPSRLVMTTAPVHGKAGSVLAAVSVTAQDAQGNTATTFTGDVSVTLNTNPGSGTLAGTTTVKAVNGVATFGTLSLNRPGTGYTFLFTSSGLSSVSSTSFDIATGNAAKLVFGPMPSTVDAGIAIAPAILVTAQDSAGNTATSFTGAVAVAIGANPGASTLGGTATRTAVAGIAAFNDLVLNKKGISYSLRASSPGLTDGVSNAFSVSPGTPVALAVMSGNAQSKPAGSVLDMITVRLRDALNNGIEGASIAFAVTGGGGTLSSAATVTDADGKAFVAWTIGSGPQTMTATFTGLPAITITATSTGTGLVWTGAISTDWNTPQNWSTGVLPTSSDDVLIPTGIVNLPELSADGYTHNLTIEAGMTINVWCSALNISGNLVAPLDAPSIYDGECNDPVYLVGDGAIGGNTVVGNFDGVWVQGDYKVSGPGNQLILTGELKVDGGNLTINGGRVDVGGVGGTAGGTFYTINGGTLTMTNSADKLFVGSGGVNFWGGSSLLTAGTLTLVDGHLYTEDPLAFTGTTLDAFAPSGTHLTVFAGSSMVRFFDPTQSFLRNAQILGGATLFLQNNTLVTRALSRGAGAGAISVVTYGYPQPSSLLTVNGLNQSGADPLQFSNVMLKLTGTSSATLGNVKFVGFGPGFTGSLFEINRTGGPFTFGGLDFSLAGFSATSTAHFLNNSGAANITLGSPIPTGGANGTHYILTGSGTVSWP